MLRVLIGLILVLVIASAAAVLALQAPTTWQPGEVLRTPADRFADLPDYPFTPHYADTLGYRVHYVDEGPPGGAPILLLHGQPSWSYLYRHMIPPLAEAGFRVIAPDLVGFGKSDKPTRQADHSYQMHVDVMTDLVRQLDLQNATYFGQDWGGLIGLRVVANEPDRFARIMISNTGLPAAGGLRGWIGYPLFRIAVWREGQPETVTDGDEFRFTRWVAWARTVDSFDFEGLFQGATQKDLSAAEQAAYAAPFPDETYQAGPRIFPYLVPSQLRQNEQVMQAVYATWDKPFLTAFSDGDPVTAGGETVWQDTVPGAQGQPHTTIRKAGHFVQEDQPDALVDTMIRFIEATPAP
ncbi:MAG: haloalkane dehalogenase [Alphaproteobacteria bacterium]